MSKGVINEARAKWAEQVSAIAELTAVPLETAAQRQARILRLRRDYRAFVEYYFPKYAACPCADFHIDAAKKILANPNLKAAFIWARAHAKSVQMDIMIPMWLMAQPDPAIKVMVLVGKSYENACVLLGDLQAELAGNRRYIADYGEQQGEGSWTEGQFVSKNGIAFFARGRGQSPRGLRYRERRPDYIVVDDIDDDEICQNPARIAKMFNWLKEALCGARDGSKGRVIVVGNLISKNSVLHHWAKIEGVHTSQVNIYDKKGGISWKEKFTPADAGDLERTLGYRSFQKEYMNNPSEYAEGSVFHQRWIQWKKPLPLHKYDKIAAYCDPSFKSGAANDYKAIKVWGRAGAELHNLRNFVRQCSVGEMVRWLYDLHESLPQNAVCDYWIEANFLQDTLLDEFVREGKQRGYQLPIRADRRKKPDKLHRQHHIHQRPPQTASA